MNGGYDAVIIATGSTPVKPDVPGIDGPSVIDALQVLNDGKQVGKKVAIVGAGVVGIEVGLFLAEQCKEVIFFEMLDDVMTGFVPDERQVYENRLNACRVSFQTGKRLERVSGGAMTFVDRFGVRTEMTADTIVLACGSKPNRDLLENLKTDSKLQVFEVGDCVRPRKIFDAIHDGHLAAKLLT